MYAAPRSAFHDVTIATNAGVGLCRAMGYRNSLCDATKGWDGPTGLGIPARLNAFTTAR